MPVSAQWFEAYDGNDALKLLDMKWRASLVTLL